MPIRLPGAMVQPCSTTLCPMVQSAPITIGTHVGVQRAAFLDVERSPTSIHSLSPRSTEPNQMLASASGARAINHRGFGNPIAAVGGEFGGLSVEFVDRHASSLRYVRSDLATSASGEKQREGVETPSPRRCRTYAGFRSPRCIAPAYELELAALDAASAVTLR